MYVKIFGSILDSSIWAQDANTKVLWITMLAMADEEGVVVASLGGLSRRAGLEPQICQESLKTLEGPDDDSRDGTTGERVVPLDGGWQILNYENYRQIQTRAQLRDAMRKRRSRHREDGEDGSDV